MDFEGTASGWEPFQRNHLQSVTGRLEPASVELYLDSLGEDRGFLELSGYVRWDASQADVLVWTALVGVGAAEVYLPGGEVLLQAVSAGVSGDGMGLKHAYGKGGIDSLRLGSWMQSGGEWALRVDGSRLSGEFRLGDGVVLSLGHEDWRQALSGSGAGRVYLEAVGVDAEWLRILQLKGLPDDLELDMDARLEAAVNLREFKPETATMEMTADVRSAALASRGVTVRGLKADGRGYLAEGIYQLSTLDLDLMQVDVSGFRLGELSLVVEGMPDGSYQTQPVRATFMGGHVQVDALGIDPDHLEALTYRLELNAVDLAQLADVIPQFKGEITGTVSGYLVGAWKGDQPILTDGLLEVDPEKGARLRYNVDGLFTHGMAADSAAYQQYRMAEKAFADLSLKRFRIEVFPEGRLTRPFRLELFGESEHEGRVLPIDFDLNVNVDDTAGLLEILRLVRQGELELN
jgi:hypothetical protein